MIVGIDTSGKISQLPMYIGAVRIKKTKILDELKKSVGERKPVVTTRRRLDGKYLNVGEIKKLISYLEYSVTLVSSPVFSKILKMFKKLKSPETRILASCIYITSKSLLKKEDILLIDKDYDYEKMKFLCSSTSFLFRKLESWNVTAEIGTSYNESIALADIVAKLARLNKIKPKKITIGELIKCMKVF